jgi:membrane protease YdiL (CAAX protease family)
MVARLRFYLEGLLKLIIAAACLVGAIAAYRLLVHPALESGLSLGKDVSSAVRRVGILAAMVFSYWGFVHFYERRVPQELALRWKWMLLAAGAGAASIGVTILILFATGHYQVVASRGFGAVGGVVGMLWVAAVLEEVAFRGILFRMLEERIGTRAALAASAVVFGVVHLSNHGTSWITGFTVTLAGLMWAGVYLLSRNIWVTAAHHCFWNATIFGVGLPLSGEEELRALAPFESVTHGSALWTGGAFGPEDSVVNLLVSGAICFALWKLARSRGLFRSASPPAA